MEKEELQTLKSFIESNNSFYSALIEGKSIYLDTPLKMELILLYFKINIKYLKKLEPSDFLFLTDLISNNTFVIDGEKIIYKGHELTIDYFLTFIKTIEDYKEKVTKSRVVDITPFTPSATIEKRKFERPKTRGRVIDFHQYHREVYFTMKERAYIFERTTKIDRDTLPYVEETNQNFTELVNDMIITAFTSGLDEYYEKYLEVLYSYLSLYPYLEYASGKMNLPFSDLKIPQSQIGLVKSTYESEHIRAVEQKINTLESRCIRLYEQKRISEEESQNSPLTRHLSNQLQLTNQERIEFIFNYYALRHDPKVYNENLLRYIVKSFEQGNVEINLIFKDPIIKMFYIGPMGVEFFCAIHLSTLVNLIQDQTLLPDLPGEKKLRLEV